ncbi:AAA family ATPase [Bosea sp. 124]|uniref:AAA family ATPase n=1 Tax=Bosea sp. 124 TaxID=2135642 RepID=UPI000D377135|nr:AAA family ATPase [Bosea sp. 124]
MTGNSSFCSYQATNMILDDTQPNSEPANPPRGGVLARLAQSQRVRAAGDQQTAADARADDDTVWSLGTDHPEAEDEGPDQNESSRSSGSPASGAAAGRAVQSIYNPIDLIVELAYEEQARAARLDLRKMPSGKTLVMVVRVPTEAWEYPLSKLMESFDQHPAVHTGKGEIKARENAGKDIIQDLQAGRTVIGIAANPDQRLPALLRGAADLQMTIKSPTPALMRKVIRRWTGRSAPPISGAELAGLDLQELGLTLRLGSSARACAERLKRASAATTVTSSTDDTPPLAELTGYGEARDWALDLVEDVRRMRAGLIPPGQLESAIFHGPPGTGKTTLARAVAMAAGLPIVQTSIADWFKAGPGYLDSVIKAASAVFDRALACAPSVLFIDELDALPDRAKISARGADWWLPVITSVLLRIDQVRADKSGVVLLGATNHVDRVDAAIRRPGRFDRSFLIPPPDAEGFAGILRLHLGVDLLGIDLLPLARQVPGSTGADAVQWIRQARRKALNAARPIVLEDLRSVMAAEEDRSRQELRTVALHEAGHTVVARSLGIEVRSVTIQAEGNAGGWAEFVIDRTPNRDQLDNQIVAVLAGRATDIVLGDGPNTGAVSDLEKATEWVTAAHAAFGLRGHLTHRGGATDAMRILAADRTLAAAVEADLNRLQDKAVMLVQRHKREIIELAAALAERRMLDANEIDAVMRSAVSGAQDRKL